MPNETIYTALSYARDEGLISQEEHTAAVAELQRKDTAISLMSRAIANHLTRDREAVQQ
jgi:hypothetical protein